MNLHHKKSLIGALLHGPTPSPYAYNRIYALQVGVFGENSIQWKLADNIWAADCHEWLDVIKWGAVEGSGDERTFRIVGRFREPREGVLGLRNPRPYTYFEFLGPFVRGTEAALTKADYLKFRLNENEAARQNHLTKRDIRAHLQEADRLQLEGETKLGFTRKTKWSFEEEAP